MWLPLPLLLGLLQLQPILSYQIDWNKLERINRGKVELLTILFLFTVLWRMTAQQAERVALCLGDKTLAVIAIRNMGNPPIEVKGFVTEDLPLYHNLEMKHIPGADPELVLITSRYEELERIPLSDMKRDEINQLLKDLGFYRKSSPDAPVPAEFKMAPARASGETKEDL